MLHVQRVWRMTYGGIFSSAKTTLRTARMSSENVTSHFGNHFSIVQSNFARKMCSNYPGIKLEPALQIKDNKTEHLSSYGHVVHTTAKQVISRHGKNENVYEMCKNEKCTCKACKIIVFYCQIRKFETFLFPSSSWLLKLPLHSK